jgi:hypothetical protein
MLPEFKTKEDVIKFVCEKLDKQGKPARQENGTCLYITKDGLKCAVGHLYHGNEFRAKAVVDNISADSGEFKVPNSVKHIPDIVSTLIDLQCFHDEWSPGNNGKFSEYFAKGIL